MQEGQERVVAYFSKALTKAERAYCVTRKELLAVVVALKKFHPYLYGKVLLPSDNAAVSWMKKTEEPHGSSCEMARRTRKL